MREGWLLTLGGGSGQRRCRRGLLQPAARRALVWGLALELVRIGLLAQETPPADSVQRLQEELRQLRQQFEQVQREQGEQIRALERQIESLRAAPPVESGAPSEPGAPSSPPRAATPPSAEPATAAPAPADSNLGVSPVPPAASWSPTQPIPVIQSGQAYMNLSFKMLGTVGASTASDATEELELGHHDPAGRGFTLQHGELALDGAVDPYLRGFANIGMSIDPEGETHVGLGEAYLLTTSLPANLQLKAGQFLAEFGRQNTQHAYQWDFVDQPLVLNRLLGPHSLRNPGARLSWLAPTPFYTETMLGVFNGEGHSAFSYRAPGDEATHGRTPLDRGLRGPGDLLFVPRVATSFDLTDTQTLVTGVSAAFGPNNSGEHARSEIYGLDWYWKWKPAHAEHGFPFLAWQTEGLYRRYEAGADPVRGLPAEDLEDWGLYSQVLWGFTRRWVAGLRGEWVDGNAGAHDALDRFRGERVRISPNLTFYPTGFSKVRLQYNLDDGDRFGTEHSVWLQGEFLLGTHGAHKF